VLDAVQQLGPNAEEYLHVLVPAITTAVETLSILNHNFDLGPYASRIVLPTLKMVQKVAVQPATQDQRDLLTAVMDLFSSMFLQLGTKFMTFYPIVDRVIRRCKIQQHQRFDLIANKVSKNTVLSDFLCQRPGSTPKIGGRLSSASTGGRLHHSTSRRRDKLVGSAANAAGAAASSTANAAAVSAQQNQKLQSLVLQRSWQISSVVSKDDWHQWLRNLTETLIRESPSVSIRACRLLAQANPAIESLISINNKLGMVESAEGVLQNAASYFKDGLRNQEFWFEKLQDLD
uniref:Non-specific serine/threonine protein kinase n=1 Tax=Macrostomum lignano TaxID=282301 RepID=A0A1I8FLD7_9PLAT